MLFTLIMLLIIAVGIAIFVYNTLRATAENVKESQSNIQVAIRKKISLINQLVETVKSYDSHEALVMLKVSDDLSPAALQRINQAAATTLMSVATAANRFPDLRANTNYQSLMSAMHAVEEQVMEARLRYNSAAKAYNVRRSGIPHVFIASQFGFPVAPYLDLESDEGSAVAFRTDNEERINKLLSDTTVAAGDLAKRAAAIGTDAARKGYAIAEERINTPPK